MISDDQLTGDLRAADRAAQMGEHDEAIRLMVAASRRTPAKKSKRRGVLIGAGILSALALGGGVAVPVAASAIRTFMAQNVPADTDFGGEAIPDSEYVDPTQPDIDEYVASLYPDELPLAVGDTREGVIGKVSGFNEGLVGTTQEVTFRQQYEAVIYCGWIGQWLAADFEEDLVAREAAAQVMVSAADWEAFNATDGGTSDGRTNMDLVRDAAAGARAGDRSAVLFMNDMQSCNSIRVQK